nr:transposase [Chthoniobacterales bacterium]
MIDSILPGFAALDLGATKIFAAAAATPVKTFGTFTGELRALCAWLTEHQVHGVAMEATGVYWIPVHDLLQAAGFKVTLFHGAHARNLPGRKSDVSDCQWHAMLHSHGLLRPCFIPEEPIRKLRSFHRLREDHLSMAAAHLLHMQRALDLMNVRLHHVLSQLHGVSGLRVIEAILAGQRDPAVLAALCAAQVLNKKKAEVLQNLEGDWQEHHLFALRQALEAYRFYQGADRGVRRADRGAAAHPQHGSGAAGAQAWAESQTGAAQRAGDRQPARRT